MQFLVTLDSCEAAEATVLGFDGREETSSDYRFVLMLGCKEEPAAIEAGTINQPVSLEMRGEGQPSRHVHGVVASVGWRGLRAAVHSFEVVLVPRLHMLRHRRTSRVFQDLGVSEIVSAILELHGVAHRWALVQPHAKRAYCVQYRETDYSFVTRLCGEEGVFFYFEHGEIGPEVVVFSDDVGLCPSIAGLSDLVYRPADGQTGLTVEEHHVLSFATERKFQPTAAVVREYDFERPRSPLTSRAVTTPMHGREGDPRYEHYEHISDYEKVDVDRDVARLRLEQLRRDSFMAAGETPCRRLVPGHRFSLSEHPVESYNRGWLVTAVEHVAKGLAAVGHERVYECRVSATPDHVQFRPAIASRAVQQVVETATVTGPQGEEIHTDVYGRIKVRFHWDREGPLDDHSSCWVRHVEPWAGAGYGTLHVPRVGMEVLVAFLGGDCDRPLCIGCVSNATHLPPFALAGEKTKSGIRTRSTPKSQGYSELSFDDATGEERVHLRAERDLSVAAGHDRRVDVGNDSIFTVAHREDHRSGSRRTHIAGLDATDVGGDQRLDVQGHSEAAIGGDRRVRVTALDRLTVEGSSEHVVQGTAMVRAGESYSLLVGDRAMAGTCQISSEGTLSLSAAHTVRVTSEQKLVLACGESTSIEIDSQGIVIRAPKVALCGAEGVSAMGNGPTLSLTDRAELVADEVSVLSKRGGLELTEDARLFGAAVKLAGPDAPHRRSQADGLAPTKPFKVQLLDEAAEPYEQKRFLVVASGERQRGETDGEGRIDIDIPEDAKLVDLTLWIDGYPVGRRRQWSIAVAELADPLTPRGALQRLKNLGYYPGGIPTEPRPDDRSLFDALSWFQKDHELDATGELDGPTAAELSAKHGY
jgi:type VI secretion system secreted protein VgrG